MLARILARMTPLNVYRSCIKELKRQGIRTAEIARRSGVHASQLRRYNKGECSVGIENAPKLAPVLGCTVAELLYGRPRKRSIATEVAL